MSHNSLKRLLLVTLVWLGSVALSLGWCLATRIRDRNREIAQRAEGFLRASLAAHEWIPRSRIIAPDSSIGPDAQPSLVEVPSIVVARAMLREVVRSTIEDNLFTGLAADHPRPGSWTGWDSEAVEMFRQGAGLRVGTIDRSGGRALRIALPMIAKNTCVSCHRDYELGAVVGITAVSLPAETLATAVFGQRPLILAHLAIAALGMIGIAIGGKIFRRQAIALEGSEARLLQLLATIPDAIFQKDRKGRYVGVNPAAARVFDRARGDWLGKTDRDLSPPAVAAATEEEDARVMESGCSTTSIRSLPTNRGERWFEISKSPLRAGSGAIAGLVGVARDVTARTQAESALAAAEAKLRSVIEQSLVAIYIVRNGKLEYWNPKFLEIFGYAGDEVARVPLRDFVAEEDQQRIGESYSSRLRRGEPTIQASFQGLRKDGNLIELEMHGSQITLDGGPAFLGVLLDVTARHRLEEQLFQARKMEAIGQLAGGVAHDFNNLLQAMIGYMQLALADIPPGARARQDVEGALKAADRAAALTEQLLVFSRRQSSQKSDLDINRVIQDSLQLLRRLIPTHIQIELEAGEALPGVYADAKQVEVILMNLCSNARDAMPEGGRIAINTSLMDVPESLLARSRRARVGKFVVLRVSDNGTGMDLETSSRIFEPFFTTKPPGKGTGLGLATVYGIAQQHGGYVHVFSEPGRGTSIRVYFPALDRPAPSRSVEMPPPADRGSETVLIAEEEPVVRSVVSRILEEGGYRVVQAGDGEEALRLFEAAPDQFHLALISAVLPGLNGRCLWERMRALKPDARALFAAAGDVEALQKDLNGNGAPGFINKPCTPDDLLRAVRKALDGGG